MAAKVRQHVANETHAERRKRVCAEKLVEALGPDELDWSTKRFHHELVRAGADISIQAVYRWLSGDALPSVDHQVLVAKVTHRRHADLYPGVVSEAA